MFSGPKVRMLISAASDNLEIGLAKPQLNIKKTRILNFMILELFKNTKIITNENTLEYKDSL